MAAIRMDNRSEVSSRRPAADHVHHRRHRHRVGVIAFMSAILAGLEANFIKRVLTSQPQIQLLAPDQIARPLRNGAGEFEDATVQRPSQRVISIDQWPKIGAQMLAVPEVTAVSPTMQGSALAVRGDASRAITLSGVEPDSYFR